MIWLGLSIAIFLGALYLSPPQIFTKHPLSFLAIVSILFLAIAWNVSPTL